MNAFGYCFSNKVVLLVVVSHVENVNGNRFSICISVLSFKNLYVIPINTS